MTDQELGNSLLNRGKQAKTSSRADMIKELLKTDHSKKDLKILENCK
jgi:hypothetical protein